MDIAVAQRSPGNRGTGSGNRASPCEQILSHFEAHRNDAQPVMAEYLKETFTFSASE
jgi:hypothetical protein